MERSIKQIAEQAVNCFEQKKRKDGGCFYALKIDSPQDLRDLIFAAHDGAFPNDFVYKTVFKLFQSIIDFDIKNLNEFSEGLPNICNYLVDIYNADLFKWLDLPVAQAYVDDAIINYKPMGIFEALQIGQELMIEHIAEYVQDYIESRLEDKEV